MVRKEGKGAWEVSTVSGTISFPTSMLCLRSSQNNSIRDSLWISLATNQLFLFGSNCKPQTMAYEGTGGEAVNVFIKSRKGKLYMPEWTEFMHNFQCILKGEEWILFEKPVNSSYAGKLHWPKLGQVLFTAFDWNIQWLIGRGFCS